MTAVSEAEKKKDASAKRNKNINIRGRKNMEDILYFEILIQPKLTIEVLFAIFERTDKRKV